MKPATMRVVEIAVPSLFLIAVLMLTGSACAPAAEHHEALHVTCAQGRSFTLRIEGAQARVQLADRELVLARKPSSLGQHFRNGNATLIVDDGFVAFVQKSEWGWRVSNGVQKGPPIGVEEGPPFQII